MALYMTVILAVSLNFTFAGLISAGSVSSPLETEIHVEEAKLAMAINKGGKILLGA